MLTESSAIRDLQSKLTFPPFTITVKNDDPASLTVPSQRPDAVLNIAFEAGASRDFAVEYKSTGGLASLRAAIMAARAYAQASMPRLLLPLVIMPFLRPEALDTLVAEKVSGLDLCGNGVLYVPGVWFGYRTGAKNRYPTATPRTSPYRGDQSIVVRSLLGSATYVNQTALVRSLAEFAISPSTVSRVLAALAEDLLVIRKPTISVVRADLLLDRLRDNYRPPVVRNARRLRLALTDETRNRLMLNAELGKVWYAAASPARYTIAPASSETVRVWASDSQSLLRGLNYEEDDRFPTMELMEIDARFPFFGRELFEGIWWTSPLQEYLESSRGGKREREAAEAIRAQWLPVAP